MPSTSPDADRSGTISASSGCHARGSSTISMSGVWDRSPSLAQSYCPAAMK
jgi:hypothetical protein